MIDAAAAAVSALTAYGVKQRVTANNMANVETPGFKAATTVMQEREGGGVSASVEQGEDSVEISKEAVDMIATNQGYASNLKVLKVSDEMTRELLKIKA